MEENYREALPKVTSAVPCLINSRTSRPNTNKTNNFLGSAKSQAMNVVILNAVSLFALTFFSFGVTLFLFRQHVNSGTPSGGSRATSSPGQRYFRRANVDFAVALYSCSLGLFSCFYMLRMLSATSRNSLVAPAEFPTSLYIICRIRV